MGLRRPVVNGQWHAWLQLMTARDVLLHRWKGPAPAEPPHLHFLSPQGLDAEPGEVDPEANFATVPSLNYRVYDLRYLLHTTRYE